MGKEGLKFAFKMIEHEFDRLDSAKQKLENQNYKLRKGWDLKSQVSSRMCIVHRSDLHFVEPLIEIRRLTKKQSISDGELLFSSPDRKKHKAFSMSNLNSPRRDSDSSNSDNDQPGMNLLRISQFEDKTCFCFPSWDKNANVISKVICEVLVEIKC